MSMSVVTGFGKESEGALWVIDFLLDKALTNFKFWSAEEDVIMSTINMLVALVDDKDR